MKLYILALLTLLLLGIALLFYIRSAELSLEPNLAQEEGCDPALNSVGYGYTPDAEVDGNTVELSLDITLQEASAPITFKALRFVGDKQYINWDTLSLDCGQTGQIINTFSPEVITTVNIVPRPLPILPSQLWRDVKENDKISEEDVLGASKIFLDASPIVIGEPSIYNPSEYENIPHKYVEEKEERVAYLYNLSNYLDPAYINYLEENQVELPFGIFFAKTSNDKSGLYTITCMLDDIQFDAFNGQRSWSGPIAEDEAVLIEGSVRVERSGWHQLLCISLNSLFAKSEEEANYYPGLISAMYIYKP